MKKQLSTVLIANRSEIALRIQATCHARGLRTVAVYAPEDRELLFVANASMAYPLTGQGSRAYLQQDELIAIALRAGADAVHPGYGFLSENVNFAKACKESGIVFIGPGIDQIEAMGDKLSAKSLMKKAGVPTVPGSDGGVANVEEAKIVAEKIGLPVIIKASAGGGGKGMRVVRQMEELESSFRACQSEGQNYFADPTVYIEKFVNDPKHIEIQVFGDSHGNVVHLFERECSMQRRHQNIIEEAPAVYLSQALKEQLYQAA